MAALTQGRNFLLRGVPRQVEEAREELLGEEHESDFFLLMRAWRFADKSASRSTRAGASGSTPRRPARSGPLFEQFLEIAAAEGLDSAERGSTARRSASASSRAFPTTWPGGWTPARSGASWSTAAGDAGPGERDREGAAPRRGRDHRDRRPRRRGERPPQHRDGGRGGVAQGAFPRRVQDVREVTYDAAAKRVVARRERRFRDLVLESKSGSDDVPLDEAAALLAREVVAGRITIDAWDESAEQWITRVNRMAEWFPEYEVNPMAPRRTG
jgi:ATP-dependent helicase HrpB